VTVTELGFRLKDCRLAADGRDVLRGLALSALACVVLAASAAGSGPRRCCPQDWVQLAAGSAASYATEHGGYEGMTADALHGYDRRVRYVEVVSADASTYCLESTVDGRSAFKNGPDAQVFLGTCADPAHGTPVVVHTPDDSQMRVRAAVPAMEAYNADHNTYKGATVKKLRHYDYGIRDVKVVRATSRTYCIESTVGPWSGFKNGPPAPVRAGTCPRRR
jgi:hypothetical protein